MNRKKNKIVFVAICILTIITPLNIKAQTRRQLEEEVEKRTKELQAEKEKIKENNIKIEEKKKKIENLETKIKETVEKITNLQKEIEENTKSIEKKSEESKQIMAYYQISNGENAYLKYAFGASTITDMIYRVSLVEQLTNYNEQIIKELKILIEETNKNKKKKKKHKENQTTLKKDLQKEKENIEAENKKIKAGMPSIEEQIKYDKKQIDDLKTLGCGMDEDIQSCTYRILKEQEAEQEKEEVSPPINDEENEEENTGDEPISKPSTNGFYRPMEHGYITQGYGGYGGHLGMDFGSNNKSIDLYPVANGQVTATYYDNYGALVVKIRHNHNGRFIYSTYAHLRNFAVKSGQYVSYKTTIGKMGNTGYSFGPHLHLEITTCDWKSEGGGCTWATYQKSTRNPASYIELPSKWNNR